MSLTTDTSVGLEHRRDGIRQLYALGLTYDQMASVLNESSSTIENDIAHMHGTDMPPRRLEMGGLSPYAFQFLCTAQCRYPYAVEVPNRRILGWQPDTNELVEQLRSVLNINTVETRLVADARILMRIWRPSLREPAWCARLLDAAFVTRNAEGICRDLVDEYLLGVASQRIEPPPSVEALLNALLHRLDHYVRNHVRPDWPNAEQAERLIQEALGLISAYHRQLLLLRFHDGQSIADITKELGTSERQVGDDLGKALRNLRNQCTVTLRCLVRPVSMEMYLEEMTQTKFKLLLEQYEAAMPAGANVAEITIVLARVQALCQTVDSLTLTTRPANRLKDTNIRFVYQLCLITEQNLRNMRGFGPACCGDIKHALENCGLSLGMRRDDPNIIAAMALRPR